MAIAPLDLSFLTQTSGLSLSGGARTRAQQAPPPWDFRVERPSREEQVRKALAGRELVSAEDRRLAPNFGREERKLFAAYEALETLSALAVAAADRNLSDLRRAQFDKKFQEGLLAVDSYLDAARFDNLVFIKGARETSATGETGIRRAPTDYITSVIHSGPFDAAPAAFAGDLQFTIDVTRNGATTQLNIDLNSVPEAERTLDRVAEEINSVLSAAGFSTRFSRVKVGEPNSAGAIEGNDFAFKIAGSLAEQISFSAPSASAAIYLAGVSGSGEDRAGQLTKLADQGASVEQNFANRIEADKAGAEARAIASGPDGSVYVVGETEGAREGQPIKGARDVFLSKYDSRGQLIYSRHLGAAGEAQGFALAVGADGKVAIAGKIEGKALSNGADIANADGFVTLLDADGVELWTKERSGAPEDEIHALAIGADGAVYAGGRTFGSLADGGEDAFVTAYSATGATVFERRFAGAGTERIDALSVAPDGELIAGGTENGKGAIYKLSAATGADVWRVETGDLVGGRLTGVSVDASGVYVSGFGAAGDLGLGGASSGQVGGKDAFVLKLSDGPSPSAQWTRFLGSNASDKANALVVKDGAVYVAGVSEGAFEGQALAGSQAAFAVKLDADNGALDWVKTIDGRGAIAAASGIAIDPQGSSVLDRLGLPRGPVNVVDTPIVTARTAARAGDHFFVAVGDGTRRKIEIEADDTLRSLTFKINQALKLNGRAEVRRGPDGDQLRISGKDNVKITLSSGAAGRDALPALGLKSGAIFKRPTREDEAVRSFDPPIAALGFTTLLSVKERASASEAAGKINDVMGKIREAHRQLTTDPALAAERQRLSKRSGPVPAAIRNQIANYQAGLQRLLSGG